MIEIDNKIKNETDNFNANKTNYELLDQYLKISKLLKDNLCDIRTDLSQVYYRNLVDLNCSRHLQIFDSHKVIPKFCFGCFNLQISVSNIFDLFRLVYMFYHFDFGDDVTRKCSVELRPKIAGTLKDSFIVKALIKRRKYSKS